MNTSGVCQPLYERLIMINPTMDMAEGQGLSKDLWYVAQVVDNNDPKQLGRIKARVPEIFNGVSDKDLPWCIPASFNHTDGANAGSGVLIIPKVGSRVQVHFQQGNPLYPEYGGYHVDAQTALQEGAMNYPDRAVVRFMNKALLVVDTKDDIIYLRSPGDLRICVVGDLQLEVMGNVTERIHGNVTRQIDGNLDETIMGNHKVTVNGSVKEHISGTHHAKTDGDYLESVGGSVIQSSGGPSTYRAGGTLALEAPMIHENSGVGAGDPGSAGDATPPTLKEWPGIRGGAPGIHVPGFAPDASALDIAAASTEDSEHLTEEQKEMYKKAGINPNPGAFTGTPTQQNTEAGKGVAPIPADCEAFGPGPYKSNLQISKYFTLGELSINAILERCEPRDQCGLSASQIVCNLSKVAKNLLDPIAAKFGKPNINCGLRADAAGYGSATSWHKKGSAADIQWPGISDQEYYNRMVWIKDNCPFSELIIEYGGNRPWLHVAFNESAISTTNFKTRVQVPNSYVSGLLALKNVPGVGGA